jgi:NAD(P)H-flavin reductase
MYEILEKKRVTPHSFMYTVHAPAVSKKAKPGQFVIIRTHEKGERIPITIAGADPEKDEVTIYFATVGVSSSELGELEAGDKILNFSGPLGNEIEAQSFGNVLCVGGGVFQGANYFLAKSLKEAGNKVFTVVSARSDEYIFLMDKVREISEKVYIATDDGSIGPSDLEFIKDLLVEHKIDHVFTFGPTSMQWDIVKLTDEPRIPTSVNLFPIMVDGTGMCGACRVTVGNDTRFACVEGPEFDGHKVDFSELISRMRYFTPQEKIAMVLRDKGVV